MIMCCEVPQFVMPANKKVMIVETGAEFESPWSLELSLGIRAEGVIAMLQGRTDRYAGLRFRLVNKN